MKISVNEDERVAMISDFLSRRILITKGYDGLAVAVIQKAFQDCYTHQGDSKEDGERSHLEVRFEAAQWLLTDGRKMAKLIGIDDQIFEEAIELLVPPKLLYIAQDSLN